MKISDTNRASGAGRVGGTDKKPAVGAAAYARTVYSSTAARSIADAASILDIPEAEFTPKVRAAITALMGEEIGRAHV